MRIDVVMKESSLHFEVDLKGYPTIGDHIRFPHSDHYDNPPSWVNIDDPKKYKDFLEGKIVIVDKCGWWPEYTIWIRKLDSK